jgi:hypothetical protein
MRRVGLRWLLEDLRCLAGRALAGLRCPALGRCCGLRWRADALGGGLQVLAGMPGRTSAGGCAMPPEPAWRSCGDGEWLSVARRAGMLPVRVRGKRACRLALYSSTSSSVSSRMTLWRTKMWRMCGSLCAASAQSTARCARQSCAPPSSPPCGGVTLQGRRWLRGRRALRAGGGRAPPGSSLPEGVRGGLLLRLCGRRAAGYGPRLPGRARLTGLGSKYSLRNRM